MTIFTSGFTTHWCDGAVILKLQRYMPEKRSVCCWALAGLSGSTRPACLILEHHLPCQLCNGLATARGDPLSVPGPNYNHECNHNCNCNNCDNCKCNRKRDVVGSETLRQPSSAQLQHDIHQGRPGQDRTGQDSSEHPSLMTGSAYLCQSPSCSPHPQ